MLHVMWSDFHPHWLRDNCASRRVSLVLFRSRSTACPDSVLIKPFFEEWVHFLGDETKCLFDNVVANVSKWEAEGEGALKDTLGQDRYERIKGPTTSPGPT